MHSNKTICDILDYLDLNINKKITINELEKTFGYNRYYLMKLFKKEINMSIFDYINKIRIYNSIKEINNTNNKLLKISINNGFYSLEYFSEIFKREIGISPSKYKKIFINNKYNYIEQELSIKVTSNIYQIKELIEYTEKYRQRRKPEFHPVRKLSIFK